MCSLIDVNRVDVKPPLPLGKMPLDDQVLDAHADVVVVLLVSGSIFDVFVVFWLDVVVDVVLTTSDIVP